MRQSRFDPGRLAAIYVGGVIGALARVGLAEAAPHGAASWPGATFAANMAGALLLGCFVSALRGHREESGGFALLTTGICGTLTTFASFQLEVFEMLDAGARRPGGGVHVRVDRRRPAPPPRRSRDRRGGERRRLDRGGVARRRDGGGRFALDAVLSDHPAQPFPLGILAVNLTGTLVLGIAAGAALDGESLALVAGGVTGSFTTFSTWMLDSERLAESERGDLALLNIGLSLLAGFAAVALGHWLGGLL